MHIIKFFPPFVRVWMWVCEMMIWKLDVTAYGFWRFNRTLDYYVFIIYIVYAFSTLLWDILTHNFINIKGKMKNITIRQLFLTSLLVVWDFWMPCPHTKTESLLITNANPICASYSHGHCDYRPLALRLYISHFTIREKKTFEKTKVPSHRLRTNEKSKSQTGRGNPFPGCTDEEPFHW